MTNLPSTSNPERSLARDIFNAAAYYLSGRRTLFILGAVLIAAAIALNWGWLVAAGLAPILIAVLPCAVMCGLGMCMHKMHGAGHGNSNADEQKLNTPAAQPTDERHGSPQDSSKRSHSNHGCCG